MSQNNRKTHSPGVTAELILVRQGWIDKGTLSPYLTAVVVVVVVVVVVAVVIVVSVIVVIVVK